MCGQLIPEQGKVEGHAFVGTVGNVARANAGWINCHLHRLEVDTLATSLLSVGVCGSFFRHTSLVFTERGALTYNPNLISSRSGKTV